jgi:hypothetical protein
MATVAATGSGQEEQYWLTQELQQQQAIAMGRQHFGGGVVVACFLVCGGAIPRLPKTALLKD